MAATRCDGSGTTGINHPVGWYIVVGKSRFADP
ncbi:MAG: hypothetical protein QOJ95_4440, partial [Mycobacterium sp.]|nr:hypothetical protein [Mycobacterium sp.]